ncbi:MAG: hypothetical protein ACK5UP_06960, partial [Bacteroidota bacterium]
MYSFETTILFDFLSDNSPSMFQKYSEFSFNSAANSIESPSQKRKGRDLVMLGLLILFQNLEIKE